MRGRQRSIRSRRRRRLREPATFSRKSRRLHDQATSHCPRPFSERDKDRFRGESFEYIARFFENSLEELAKRNEAIEGDFRRVDANTFTAAIYRNGQAVSRCTVFVGDRGFSGGIAYSASEHFGRNSYNELLSVDADDESLFLRSTGMASGRQRHDAKLTQEGAAELYWGMLIGPLQPRR